MLVLLLNRAVYKFKTFGNDDKTIVIDLNNLRF